VSNNIWTRFCEDASLLWEDTTAEKTSSAHQSSVLIFFRSSPGTLASPLLLLNAGMMKQMNDLQLKRKCFLPKLLFVQHVNRMPRNRLPRLMKHYSPTGRRNRGRPLKRLLDTWDRNGSKSGPTPWEIYDDNYYYYMFLISYLL